MKTTKNGFILKIKWTVNDNGFIGRHSLYGGEFDCIVNFVWLFV